MLHFSNTQMAKAYMALMANLTKLLGATEHQSVDAIIQELKEILFFEVQMVKVIELITLL